MPILSINSSHEDVLHVMAAMAYPREVELRNRYLASFRGTTAAKIEQMMLSRTPSTKHTTVRHVVGALLGEWLAPLGGFKILTSLRERDEILDHWAESVWPGSVAGNVLLHAIELQVSELKPSVNKAVFLEERYLSNARTQDGRNLGKSNRYIREQWERFKPACHIWAAYRLELLGGIQDDQLHLSEEGLPGFLGVSEILLQLGAAIRPHGRKEGLLDLRGAWRVPRDYKLPDVRLKPPPPAEWKQEALKEYRGPQNT